MFTLTTTAIDPAALRQRLAHPAAGGIAIFEGVVRDHHQGRAVLRLEYEAFAPMALKVGAAILDEARGRWQLLTAAGCHRTGRLEIGEAAVWIGVATAHRGEAFAACAWIMDRVKERLPVWKREFFADGTVEWSRGSVPAAS
jgi:molybdopterin synthase catalytic subunit